MATFPLLRSGAVAQYPFERRARSATQVLRFLDGSEQKYRGLAAPLHAWRVTLDLLDDVERDAIDAFFVAQQGAVQTFAFTDPWDGAVYPNCRLGADDMQSMEQKEMQTKVVIEILENHA